MMLPLQQRTPVARRVICIGNRLSLTAAVLP